MLCSPVPEKQNKKASPSTIPGIVFVTSAIPSMIRFHTAPRELLAVISALPYAASVPKTAVKSATYSEFLYTPIKPAS